ncbi:MAG: glycerate kinase [Ignavibacteriaceae bacterium]
MNILIAPNSYKECVDSVRIAQIIHLEIGENSQVNLFIRPLSDGGDGFRSAYNFIQQVNTVSDYKIVKYKNYLLDYLLTYSNKNKTIFIESAELFGLKSIPESKRDPLIFNSELLGKIIEYLSQEVSENRLKIEKVYVGVGGTATIDFGIGACSQLGLILYNEKDEEIEPIPVNFNKTKRTSFTKKTLPFKIKCIVDVETELIGNPGAIEIYGKQKGANENDLAFIKKGIKNILNLIQRDLGIIIPETLNGAGGGWAAGLNLFYDAEIIPARKFIKEVILNDIILDEIDLVISGEGNFDFQSFEGKGPGVILDLFKNRKAKIILINGDTTLAYNNSLPQNLTIINLVDFFHSKEESIKNVEIGIKKAMEIVKSQFGL